jgi:hypothetical protein
MQEKREDGITQDQADILEFEYQEDGRHKTESTGWGIRQAKSTEQSMQDKEDRRD